MKKKPFVMFGIAVVAVFGIAFCCFQFFSGFGSTSYYTQIDNTKFSQVTPQGPIDLSGNGGMSYSYTLLSYEENGSEKEITFGVSRELREGAFLCLTVQPGRGVLNWSEVQYNELPPSVREHYTAPSDN